jgi:hypothetical protein
VGARIDDVHSINVISLNVLDEENQTFICEPEIEAEIALDIDIEVEEFGYAYDFETRQYSVSQTRTEYFYPEVVVRFELATGSLEFESISLGSHAVRVGIDDIESRSYR